MLISYIKKICIGYQRFDYANNIKISYISKLLDRMRDFNRKYNLAKIYSNFKVSDIKKTFNSELLNNYNLQNPNSKKSFNNNPQTKIINKIKIFKITNSEFDKLG